MTPPLARALRALVLLAGGGALFLVVAGALMRRAAAPVARMLDRPTAPGRLVALLAPPAPPLRPRPLANRDTERLTGWIRFPSREKALRAAATLVGQEAQVALLCTVEGADRAAEAGVCAEGEEALARVHLCRAAGAPRLASAGWPAACAGAAPAAGAAFLGFRGSNPAVETHEWQIACLKEACKEGGGWPRSTR